MVQNPQLVTARFTLRETASAPAVIPTDANTDLADLRDSRWQDEWNRWNG